MFDIKIHTAPVSELISLSDLKSHLAITHTDDDTYLTALIKQVREATERYCGISIGSQTRMWTFDFDGCEWEIPYGPVASITSIARKKAAGDYGETLAANTDYDLDGEHEKTLNVFTGGRCKVTYVTGYTTLPDGLKRGMLEEMAFRYEHRGDDNNTGELSKAAKMLVVRYKDFNWD